VERTLHRSGAALGRSHPSLASLLAKGLLGLALLVSVAGRAAAVSCVNANPSSLAFGNQTVGSPATRTFNISNCGDVALVISSVQVTGATPKVLSLRGLTGAVTVRQPPQGGNTR